MINAHFSMEFLCVIPLLVMHVGLMYVALRDLLPRQETALLPKTAWIILVVLGGVVGPVLYWALGRGMG